MQRENLNDSELEVISLYIECDEIGTDRYQYNSCLQNEFCILEAIERCNHEYAESIDYGGCDSEEEFWEMLFD